MSRWTIDDAPDQTGRTVVVTGANSGLGRCSAEALASRGARVILACRDASKGSAALAAVRARATGEPPRLVHLDLADLGSVRTCAKVLADELDAVDVLLNNAGVMNPPARLTNDGFEIQFGTNHLGHFALTGLILRLLRRSATPRVVVVSSNGHRFARMRFDDLNWERAPYNPWLAYTQSKLANLLFVKELVRRSAEAGSPLVAVAAHPGYAATNLIASGPGSKGRAMSIIGWVSDHLFAQSDAKGALPQLYAATMPEVGPGDYYGPDGFLGQRGWPTKVGRSAAADDPDHARRLWDCSARSTGVTYDWT